MSLEQTYGTKEQVILLDRVAHKLAELSGASELTIKGYIRKSLETVLGDSNMKQKADASPEERLKVVVGCIKETINILKLDETKGMEEAIKVYMEWKKDFNK